MADVALSHDRALMHLFSLAVRLGSAEAHRQRDRQVNWESRALRRALISVVCVSTTSVIGDSYFKFVNQICRAHFQGCVRVCVCVYLCLLVTSNWSQSHTKFNAVMLICEVINTNHGLWKYKICHFLYAWKTAEK